MESNILKQIRLQLTVLKEDARTKAHDMYEEQFQLASDSDEQFRHKMGMLLGYKREFKDLIDRIDNTNNENHDIGHQEIEISEQFHKIESQYQDFIKNQ